MGAKSFNYAAWLRSKPNPRGQFISPENANILANLATSVFLINIKGNNWEIVKNHNRTDQLFKNGKLLSSGGGIDNQKGRIKALTGVDVNEVTTSTSQFLLGSTTGAVSFTPLVEVTSSISNPQSRSIIRIDTSQSGLSDGIAKITLNVIVRDSAFLGKTITTNVIDANTGLRFSGSTSNFILRDREQRVSNIVWIESRDRISGQVILSLQGEDFSRGANFEFQSTTIPDRPPEPMPDFPPIPEEPPIQEDRNLFQSAIIGVLALGALGGSLLDKRRKR